MKPQAGTIPSPDSVRAQAVRRLRRLNRLTIWWNVVEGAVAVAAGVAASSVSLIGFGLDSGIEVSAALVLAWRLRQERREICMDPFDRRAVRLVAVSFAALAVYVGFEAVRDLATGAEPEVSVPGIIVAGLSLAFMPWLSRAKGALAPILGSSAAAAEARQTMLCAALSAILLAGLALRAGLGWWWADPIAALGIAVMAGREARDAWKAESLEDTCCA